MILTYARAVLFFGLLFLLAFTISYFELLQAEVPPLSCPEANITIPACPACPAVSCPDSPACPACPDVVVEQADYCIWENEVYTSWLDEVASSVYRERRHNGKESWDCDDMAEETAKRLENTLKDIEGASIKCKVVYGKIKQEDGSLIGHAYPVCDLKGIIFESTSGAIVPPWDYADYI